VHTTRDESGAVLAPELFAHIENSISKIRNYSSDLPHLSADQQRRSALFLFAPERRGDMLSIFSSATPRKVALGATLLALSAGAALAQAYPREVVAHCARIVSQMSEVRCMTCDSFRDRMEWACEANGGRIPGSRTIFGGAPFDNGPTLQDRRAQ
jgi:hypothetical protein